MLEEVKDGLRINRRKIRYSEFYVTQSFIKYDIKWNMRMKHPPPTRYNEEFGEQSVRLSK